MTRVKICGITNIEDALMAVECGADAIGVVNIPESKRFVDLEKARGIFEALPVFVSKVVVSAPDSIEEALEVEKTGADYIQLHGDETIEFVRQLKEKSNMGVIKKIAVGKNYVKDSTAYSKTSDAILLDTDVKGMPGGTGKTHDWKISREVVKSIEKPVILAGGLNPENVREAIEKVKPYAVDVSSGVESKPGKKDQERIRRFIHIVKKYSKI